MSLSSIYPDSLPHGVYFYVYTLKWNDGFYLPQFAWIVCAVEYWCGSTSKQIRLQGHFHGDPLIVYTFSRSLFIFIFIYVSNTSSILEPLCENELAQLLAMWMPHHHHVHIYFIRKNFNWLIKLHCLEKSPIKAQDSSNFCPGKHKRSS